MFTGIPEGALLVDHFSGGAERRREEARAIAARLRAAMEKLICRHTGKQAIAVQEVVEITGANYDSAAFLVTVEVGDAIAGTREQMQAIVKICKHTASPEELQQSLIANTTYQEMLERSKNGVGAKHVPLTERCVAEWEGDDLARITLITFQEYIRDAVPLAQLSLKEVRRNPELARNLAEFFEKLASCIRTAQSLRDLPDL